MSHVCFMRCLSEVMKKCQGSDYMLSRSTEALFILQVHVTGLKPTMPGTTRSTGLTVSQHVTASPVPSPCSHVVSLSGLMSIL